MGVLNLDRYSTLCTSDTLIGYGVCLASSALRHSASIAGTLSLPGRSHSPVFRLGSQWLRTVDIFGSAPGT